MTTLEKLNNYIAAVPPHQSDRVSVKLIIRSRDEIVRLRASLEKIKDCDYPLGQTAISVAKEALGK